MTTTAKIHRGMQRQLQQWRNALAAGDERLGWKIGFNRVMDQQKFELPSPMVGYLTRKRQLVADEPYPLRAGSKILVEAEIALLMGRDVAPNATFSEARNAIAGYAPALELVDTTRTRSNDIEAILAGNLFHEAVVIGDVCAIVGGHFSASLILNGSEIRQLEPDRLPDDFGKIVKIVAEILAQHGERLLAGDWIISGAATTPIEVHDADEIKLELEPLGTITFTTTRAE